MNIRVTERRRKSPCHIWNLARRSPRPRIFLRVSHRGDSYLNVCAVFFFPFPPGHWQGDGSEAEPVPTGDVFMASGSFAPFATTPVLPVLALYVLVLGGHAGTQLKRNQFTFFYLKKIHYVTRQIFLLDNSP